MNTATIILIILWSIGLLVSANRHGKPRTNHDFFVTLIAEIINISLLWWAGLFENL